MKYKLLFIGFNRKYVNRTFLNLISSIQSNFDLFFYGPGYTSNLKLGRGVKKFIEEKKSFDIILYDAYILEFNDIVKRKRPFSGDYLYFNKNDYYKYGLELYNFITTTSLKKIFISNMDIYNVSKFRIELLIKNNSYIICPPSENTISELEDKFNYYINNKKEKGFIAGYGNDNWINFLKKNKEKIIETPASIAFDQFRFNSFLLRKNLLAVPGVSYSERKKIYNLLSFNQKLEKIKYKLIDKIYLMFNDSLSFSKIQSINYRYDYEISNSKFSFVSGSKFRRSVRKYYEIPALGSLPIGQECDSFNNLGFVDGKNFIIAEKYNDVKKIINNYNSDECEEIILNAQKNIIINHSEFARSKHIKESFNKILKNKFKGSYWKNGKYMHY